MILCVACFLALLTSPFPRTKGLDVDPKTYVSRSGKTTLHVDPSDRHGNGPAKYTLRRGETFLWEKEFPVTLVDIALSHGGAFGGYGYTPRGRRVPGLMHVMIVGPDGEIRYQDKTKRIEQLCSVAYPSGSGLAIRESRDRFVFDLWDHDGSGKLWWMHRLSNGERLWQLRPRDPPERLQWIVRALRLHELAREGEPSGPQRRIDLPELGTVPLRVADGDPGPTTISSPMAAAVGPFGGIHVLYASGEVLVFDLNGERVLSCRALPRDAKEASMTSSIALGPLGDIYVSRREGYLHFDAQGRRQGVVDLGAHHVAFRPGSDHRWGRKDDDLVLLNASGEVLSRNTRRPGDRHWLRGFGQPAVAPDGRAAVVSEGLAVFSPEGEPLKTIPLPEGNVGWLAFSGRWAAHSPWFDVVSLVDVKDGSVFRFDPDQETEWGAWMPAFSPDGRELWMINLMSMVLHRFALPE